MLAVLAAIMMIAGAGFAGAIATAKHRNGLAYGIMGAIFPILTIIVALAVSKRVPLGGAATA